MNTLERGQKAPLQSPALTIEVLCQGQGLTIDISCFGVDSGEKLSDERYMVFYNQKASPEGAIRLQALSNGQATFGIDLQRLPLTIDKLVFTAAVDGPGQMNAIGPSFIRLGEQYEFGFQGSDFAQEKAIIIAKVYRRAGQWRIDCVGQGFSGGLSALLASFGGEEASDPAPAAPVRLSLVKRIEKQAPQLVNLAKKAEISLEKKRLLSVTARVGLVLDASGSMCDQYDQGKVQQAIERMIPLAVHFDDDGKLETWAFGSEVLQLPDAGTSNIQGYTDRQAGGWNAWMDQTGVSNNEPEAIRAVVLKYSGLQAPAFEEPGFFSWKKPVAPPPARLASPSKLAAYVVFISDGGIYEDAHIEYLLRWASGLPIFWQFVGIGGSDYGILERLDTLEGRVVDNCGFFALDDLEQISEGELYDRLLEEFPAWLSKATAAGILAPNR